MNGFISKLRDTSEKAQARKLMMIPVGRHKRQFAFIIRTKLLNTKPIVTVNELYVHHVHYVFCIVGGEQ